MNIVSIRINDEEKQILDQAMKVYNCGISTLMKTIVFEKLEDDFDLKLIQKHEENKKNKTAEYIEIEDVWKELGI